MAAPDFLAITGATATGKTALSLAVAEALDGEVISMDSRQIYRGMDIGTDKVAAGIRARVPHHGVDIRDPDESYSAGEFARDAARWMSGIRACGRVPVLAGGTGFFLKALVEPLFEEPPLDPARVERLRRYLGQRGMEELERWVRVLDPERARLAVAGGMQRIERTLEVTLLTGRPLSWWHQTGQRKAPAAEAMVVVLEVPREELYRRINARVGTMAERGLIEEVRVLAARGYGRGDPGMTGTGYREILEYLEGRLSLEDALDATRRATRRYARRQLTWFRNQLPPDSIRIDGMQPPAAQCGEVLEAWRARGRDDVPPDEAHRGVSGRDEAHGGVSGRDEGGSMKIGVGEPTVS